MSSAIQATEPVATEPVATEPVATEPEEEAALAIAAIHARFGAALRNGARELTQQDLVDMCEQHGKEITDVVKARGILASITKLDTRVLGLDASIAASDQEYAGLGLTCDKYNYEERLLDDAKTAVQTQIARLSDEVESLCKGLEGRLGVIDRHPELINRLVYLKPGPLDFRVADAVRTGAAKVLTAPDGASRFVVVDSITGGGPHLLPVVDMQNMGAIVSPCAQVTTKNYTTAQAVCDSESFVTHGLTAPLPRSDGETHKAWDAMLTAYGYTPRDQKKPRVFRPLVQKISQRTVATPLNPTFFDPDLEVVEATYQLLCQNEGTQGALRCLRALATHMERVADEMTKNAYYTLPVRVEPRAKRHRAAPCEDTPDESMCVD